MIKKVIISGGGTGGHIYPAVAIAEELQRRNSEMEILFVGASDRMEMQKIPELGYAIKGLWISGFQRSLSFWLVLNENYPDFYNYLTMITISESDNLNQS